MAYVIAEPCIGTKDASCPAVCPFDRIHPTPDAPGFEEAEHLYIGPSERIDCDACVEGCPVEAVFPRIICRRPCGTCAAQRRLLRPHLDPKQLTHPDPSRSSRTP
jgi:ferredoxin